MPAYIHPTINSPCNENWQKMKLSETGKFCSSCQTNVIDFTQYSDEQLIDFFKNTPKGFCGRFKAEQLNRTYLIEKPTTWILANYWKGLTSIAATLALSINISHSQIRMIPNNADDYITTTSEKNSKNANPEAKEDTAFNIKINFFGHPFHADHDGDLFFEIDNKEIFPLKINRISDKYYEVYFDKKYENTKIRITFETKLKKTIYYKASKEYIFKNNQTYQMWLRKWRYQGLIMGCIDF